MNPSIISVLTKFYTLADVNSCPIAMEDVDFNPHFHSGLILEKAKNTDTWQECGKQF